MLRGPAVVVPQLNFRAVGREAIVQVKGAVSGENRANSVGSIALQVNQELLIGGSRVSANIRLRPVAAGAVRNLQRGAGRVLRLDDIKPLGTLLV